MEIDHTEMATNFAKKTTVLDANHLNNQAYKFVTSEKITNCFQNALRGEKFEKTLDYFPLPTNISLESFQVQLKSF